jgi:hypothetical protein
MHIRKRKTGIELNGILVSVPEGGDLLGTYILTGG